MNMFKTNMAAPLALCAAVVVLMSCKTTVEVIDNMSAAPNRPGPKWVELIKGAQGISAVEALPQYSGKHCFVVTSNVEGANRDFVLNWVKNAANGSAEVARFISTEVLTDAQERSKNAKGSEEEAAVGDVARAIAAVSFSGLRKESEWWETTRNKATKDIRTTAYALWIVDKKFLDTQIADKLQDNVEKSKALSQADRSGYIDYIQDIRAKGFNNR